MVALRTMRDASAGVERSLGFLKKADATCLNLLIGRFTVEVVMSG